MKELILLCICCLASTFGFELSQTLPFLSSTAIKVSSNYVFIGDLMNVTCFLSDTDVTQGYSWENITFYHADYTSNLKEFLDPDDITMVDSRTATLTITATAKSAGAYQCLLKKLDSDGYRLLGALDDRVEVEYRPQPVINFTCEVFNWIVNITCRWAFPVSYIVPSNLNITVDIVRHKSMKPDFDTHCLHMSDTNCIWKDSSLSYINLTFKITISNKKDPTAGVRQFVFIEPNNYVRPKKVEGFKVTPSPGCFHFQWKRSYGFSVIFRIHISTSEDASDSDDVPDNFRILANNLTADSLEFEACSFPAYYQRMFCIEAFPIGDFNGFWSHPVCSRKIRTPIEAPSEAPEITPGSHVTGSDSCEGSTKRHVTVTVFWKPLANSKWNGEVGGYQLTFNGYKTVAYNNSFDREIVVPCETKSVIDIHAFNEVGLSPLSAQWLIEPFQFSVPSDIQRSFVAHSSGSLIKVSWVFEERGYKKYIYWCKGYPANKKCDVSLNWVEIKEDQQDKVLPIDPSQASTYLYGISVQEIYKNHSSGIFWTSCLTQKNAKIYPPDNIDVVLLKNGIKVTWYSQSCSYERNYKIDAHILTWCFIEKCEEQFVPFPHVNYIITDVIQDETYNVTIQTFADNKKSDVKEWKSIIVPSKAENGSFTLRYKLVLVCVVLGVMILLLFLGIHIRNGIKEIQKEFNEDDWNDFQKLPDFMLPPNEETLKRDFVPDNFVIDMPSTSAIFTTCSPLPVAPCPLSSSSSPFSSSANQSCCDDFQSDSGARLLPENRYKERGTKTPGKSPCSPVNSFEMLLNPIPSPGVENNVEKLSNISQPSWQHDFALDSDYHYSQLNLSNKKNSDQLLYVRNDSIDSNGINSTQLGSSELSSKSSQNDYTQFLEVSSDQGKESKSSMDFNSDHIAYVPLSNETMGQKRENEDSSVPTKLIACNGMQYSEKHDSPYVSNNPNSNEINDTQNDRMFNDSNDTKDQSNAARNDPEYVMTMPNTSTPILNGDPRDMQKNNHNGQEVEEVIDLSMFSNIVV